MVQKTNNVTRVFEELIKRWQFDFHVFGNVYMKVTYNKDGLLDSIKFEDPSKIKIKVKKNDKQN